MKRLIGTIKGRGEERRRSDTVLPKGDSPEAIVAREVTAFCESGGPNNANAGNEYLHLPAIVDAAESSPAAASEAARRIHKYLSKENYQKAYAQYNAIMLTRILTDNPAERFTRNFDAKFVTTTKELLREGRDRSVQQILRETLDYFEMEKVAENPGLVPLVEMWKKEKSKSGGRPYNNAPPGTRTLNAPPFIQQRQQPQAYFGYPNNLNPGLPPPDELAARIEEAKTTARLLLQTIQSTPNSEVLSNDLIKEFADRASAANRSIQSYINADDPPPDEDTMLTLIETNEQLSIAMSKHQRAVLQARKALNATPSPQPRAQSGQNGYSQQPTQSQGGQNMYPSPLTQAQPGQTTHTILAPSPHRVEREAQIPPPGPPPAAMGAIRTNNYIARANNNAYSSPPPIPARSRPMSQDHTPPTRTLEYGVAENPFSDPYLEQQQPQQKLYTLFDRPSQTTPPLPQESLQQPQQKSYSLFDRPSEATPPPLRQESQQQPQQKLYSLFDGPSQNMTPPLPQESTQQSEQPQATSSTQDPARMSHEPYNPGHRSTPSYIDRQESAANNLTMHGGSPPEQGQTEGRGQTPSSLVEQTRNVQRRVGRVTPWM